MELGVGIGGGTRGAGGDLRASFFGLAAFGFEEAFFLGDCAFAFFFTGLAARAFPLPFGGRAFDFAFFFGLAMVA